MVPRPNERPAFAGPDSGPEAPFPLRLEGPVIKGFGRGSKELGIPTANIPISGLSIAGHEDLESGIYFGWAGLCTEGIADATENNTNQMNSSSNSSNTVDMDAADTGASAAEVAETQRRAALAAGQDAGASAPAPAQDQSPSEKKKPLHGEVYPMVMSIGWNPFYKNSVRSAEIHLCHSFTKDFYGARLRLLILGYVRPELDYVSKEALIEDIRTDIRVAERSLFEREAYARYKGEEWLREF